MKAAEAHMRSNSMQFMPPQDTVPANQPSIRYQSSWCSPNTRQRCLVACASTPNVCSLWRRLIGRLIGCLSA